MKVRVDAVADESVDVRSFRLVGLDDTGLPEASAGSHVNVRTPGGPERQYSLCEPGRTDRYTIAVKLEASSRGGSVAMHRVSEGDILEISGPRNAFPLADDAERHILIAGGIGITPILAMARRLAGQDEPFTLHYFARSVEHMAFHGVVTADPIGRSTEVRVGLDPAGTVHALQDLLTSPASGTHVYVCGPAPLMDAVRVVALERGWPEEAIHEERFTAPRIDPDEQSGFRVVLERSGTAVDVASEETVLDAVARAGVEIDHSCEQGICGTCVTTVLGGQIDHRDAILTDDEKQAGDQMCVCVSRCTGPELRLDI